MKELNTSDDDEPKKEDAEKNIIQDSKKKEAETSDDETKKKEAETSNDEAEKKEVKVNVDGDEKDVENCEQETLDTSYEEESSDEDSDEENLQSILNKSRKTVKSEDTDKLDVLLEPTYILDVSSYSSDHLIEKVNEEDALDDNQDPLAFTCKECDIIFLSNEMLTKHKLREHRGDLQKCKFCRRMFISKSELLEHQVKHLTSKEHLFKCSVCQRHFFTQRLLAAHEQKHNEEGALYSKIVRTGPRGKNAFQVQCNVCSNDFSSKLTFRRHIEDDVCTARTDEMKYVCTICYKVVAPKEKDKHYCNPRFTCGECNKELTTKTRLIKHLEKSHSRSAKKLQSSPTENYCLECELQFDSNKEYNEHNTETGHNILKLLSCKICKKMFTKENELIKHTKRHEIYFANCKYTCRYCQAKFAQPQKLISHYGGAHSKEKPYKCVQCDLDFQNKTKFATHIRLEHKGAGKMKFLRDFSISFVPNASDPNEDGIEIDETLEIGAIETVETSEPTEKDKRVTESPSEPPVPSLSYLREFEAMKIISKINEKSRPNIKRRVVNSAKELKLNLVKNVEVSQKVIIKKITEDEAREKKRMVINAVPFTKENAGAKRRKSPLNSPISRADHDRNSLDEFLTFGNDNDNDFTAADDSDNNEMEVPLTDGSILLVNSNPLENLLDKTNVQNVVVTPPEQPKIPTTNNYVNMIIDTLMASAAKQQDVMMGPGPKRKRGMKPRYEPKKFDYESIIKKSLVVDKQAVKEREEKIKKKKEEKKEPKSKYKPKEYDYFNIISTSLKYEEAEKKESLKKKKQSKGQKKSKRIKTEF